MNMFNYAITISQIPLYRTSRIDIFKIFDNYSIELLVAQEDHADMYSVHYHVFISSQSEVIKIDL